MDRKLACLLAGIVLTLSGIGLAGAATAAPSDTAVTVVADGNGTTGEWPPMH